MMPLFEQCCAKQTRMTTRTNRS